MLTIMQALAKGRECGVDAGKDYLDGDTETPNDAVVVLDAIEAEREGRLDLSRDTDLRAELRYMPDARDWSEEDVAGMLQVGYPDDLSQELVEAFVTGFDFGVRERIEADCRWILKVSEVQTAARRAA